MGPKTHAEEMKKDLRRAQVVHKALLPTKPPDDPRYRFAFRYLPYEEPGGDFISFPSLSSGGRGLFLSDMKGHGVSAALFVALVKFVSDRLSLEWGEFPSRFLSELNRSLFDRRLCRLPCHGWCRGSHLGRGHPSPVLVREGKEPEFLTLPPGGALGVIRDMNLEMTEVTLDAGDRLFFHTDGLSETRSAPDRVRKPEDLPELVGACSVPSLNETLDLIVDASRMLQPEGGLADDVVICGVERE